MCVLKFFEVEDLRQFVISFVFVFAICKFVKHVQIICTLSFFLQYCSCFIVGGASYLLIVVVCQCFIAICWCFLVKGCYWKHEPPILSTFLICCCLAMPCCSLLLFVFGYVPPIFGAPHHSILCKCGRRNLNDYFKFFQATRQVCIFFLCLFVFVYLGFK